MCQSAPQKCNVKVDTFMDRCVHGYGCIHLLNKQLHGGGDECGILSIVIELLLLGDSFRIFVFK